MDMAKDRVQQQDIALHILLLLLTTEELVTGNQHCNDNRRRHLNEADHYHGWKRKIKTI